MAIDLPKENWTGRIGEFAIGATKREGGTRDRRIVVGGATTLPFLYFEGQIPHKPVIAFEIMDTSRGYPKLAGEEYGNIIEDPPNWAKECLERLDADLICLKLEGTNPEEENHSAEDSASLVREILKKVQVPLMVYGCGHEQKDAEVLSKVSEEGAGERLVLGLADESTYKVVADAATPHSHGIVAFSNIDVNLAKQTNILLKDYGVGMQDIIMDPLQSSLGMGLEYSYSVIERIRIAALSGDEMLQVPIVCDTSICWKSSEGHEPNERWGNSRDRAASWEAVTAISALTAGADMLIMRFPPAIEIVRKAIQILYPGKEYAYSY